MYQHVVEVCTIVSDQRELTYPATSPSGKHIYSWPHCFCLTLLLTIATLLSHDVQAQNFAKICYDVGFLDASWLRVEKLFDSPTRCSYTVTCHRKGGRIPRLRAAQMSHNELFIHKSDGEEIGRPRPSEVQIYIEAISVYHTR